MTDVCYISKISDILDIAIFSIPDVVQPYLKQIKCIRIIQFLNVIPQFCLYVNKLLYFGLQVL